MLRPKPRLDAGWRPRNESSTPISCRVIARPSYGGIEGDDAVALQKQDEAASRIAGLSMAALLCVPAQQLAALQINQVEPGTGGTGYRFVLRVGRILVLIVEGMLNVEVGIRASENKRSHSSHTTSNSALAKADLLRSWHGPPRSPAKQASRYLPKRRSGRSRPLRVSDETKPKNAVLVRQGEVGGLPHRMPAVLRMRAFLLRSRAIQLVGMFKSLLGGIVATLDYYSAPVPLSEEFVLHRRLWCRNFLPRRLPRWNPHCFFISNEFRNHEPPRTSSGMEMALA